MLSSCVRLAAEDEDLVVPCSHGMTGAARWRRTHVREHIPSLIWKVININNLSTQAQSELNLLEILKAARSSRSLPSTLRPPKT